MATSGLSAFLEDEILDQLFGAAAYTAPTPIWFALYSAAPTKAGGGTELTGNGYGRVSATNNLTTWAASSSSVKLSDIDITLGPATGGAWSEATHWGIFDAETVGNLLCWGPLTVARTAGEGDSIKFTAGDISISLDNVT